MDKYTEMIIEVIEYYAQSVMTTEELQATILTLIELKEHNNKKKKGKKNEQN